MTTVVGLMNYGVSGNIFSVQKALERAGAMVKIIKTKKDFKTIDKIVLPGVGSFKDAMGNIGDLRSTVCDQILEHPTLGICLGMQILAKIGYEFGETQGLDLIDAEVKRIEVKCKVPHLGWGRLSIVRNSPLLSGITDDDNFYFMHSYEVINYTDVIALTNYCNHKFVSVIQKKDIYGVQFHPEKSREAGIAVLNNFINL